MYPIEIALLRHGPTEWNKEKRYQGRTDIPLSAEGEAWARGVSLPEPYCHWPVFSSPLARAQRTAEIIGDRAPEVLPFLEECHFGRWEGQTRSEIGEEYADFFGDQEYHGLDFKPHQGESLRDVQERILAGLEGLSPGRYMCFTHKMVMTAAYALATDWSVLSRPPHKINYREVLHLGFDKGKLHLVSYNNTLRSN